jgi:hypothetical protein
MGLLLIWEIQALIMLTQNFDIVASMYHYAIDSCLCYWYRTNSAESSLLLGIIVYADAKYQNLLTFFSYGS